MSERERVRDRDRQRRTQRETHTETERKDSQVAKHRTSTQNIPGLIGGVVVSLNFTHIASVYPVVYWEPGGIWGSSPSSCNINGSGKANAQLSLSCLMVLG